MNNKPDTLIESNGYVYKLLTSKEEQMRLDNEAEKKRVRNLGTFKSKIGSEQYEYLHTNNVTIKYEGGSNYRVVYFYDFGAELYWSQDEYSTSDKKNFGDKDWYTYDGTAFNNQYTDTPIHKAIQDYYFNEFVKDKS